MIKDFERRDEDRKKILKWSILAVLLLAAVVTASVHVRSFEVTGNTRYTDEELLQMIYPERWDTNSLYGLIKDRFIPHPQLPFVERYDIMWKSPVSVEIVVYEKNIVGYVDYMSSHMYFDKDGIIVESTGTLLEGVPHVTGLDFGSIVLYQPLPVSDSRVFGNILNLTGALSSYGIACDEISYDKLLNATLTLGGIEVYLGSSQDMEMKISTLNDMLPQLEGLEGELDLSVYSENATEEAYIFKKK